MKQSDYLSASEAAGELGINLTTLYSYVSRGLLRSEFADHSKRTRRYHVEDVQRLKERQEMRRDPQKVVGAALHWGAPMLDSALTLIDGGRCYYRGKDVMALAVENTVEQVATLLWTGEEEQAEVLFSQRPPDLPFFLPPKCVALLPQLHDVTPMERLQALLPLAAADDLASYDFRPAQAAQTGARLLRRMTLLAIGKADAMQPTGLATMLQRAWVPDQPQAIPLFTAALILCADHELNVSTFTARCAASAGSTLYAVISAGLAALQGVKHGGISDRVEALFRETDSPKQAHTTLAQRIRRGEVVPGFGHRLYPDGDPRGRLLLAMTSEVYPQTSGVLLASALVEAAQDTLHEQPNLDFGLATLCSALSLPAGTAIALFALGRAVGWIGHAIEEYQADRLIRPRAHYIGNPPPSRLELQ